MSQSEACSEPIRGWYLVNHEPVLKPEYSDQCIVFLVVTPDNIRVIPIINGTEGEIVN